MPDLIVNGRNFRDLDGYNAAKRDYANIERMRERIDMTSVDEVSRLKDNIESGRYKFETVIGEDFVDELDDLIKELKATQGEDKSRRKSANNGKIKGSSIRDVNVRDNTKVRKRIGDSSLLKGKNETDSVSFDDYDENMQKAILKEMKKSDIKRRFFVILMALIAVGSLGYLVFYGSQYAKNEVKYNELAVLVDETAKETEYSITLTQDEEEELKILKKYEAVYQKNKKVVGWLTIPGTKIDYPVMQTVNNDYYLDHNFDQEYDKNGSIFLDKDCDPGHPNDNMIIYGHHMKSGKMFGNLNYYAKESYFKEHPYINFDTIYAEGTYQVMYVFRSQIYNEEDIVFKYYKFIDATSEDEFYSNLEEMQAISLYDTGVRAVYGDKLITLSTCDSSANNGRFVVVAKKVR